ncbi:DIE2/ALG10 family protein [Cooperia oncophora]
MPATAEQKPSTQLTEHRKDWLFAGLVALAHAFLVTVVYHYVPEPYMDEIFHVRQTRKYCSGNWSWDPMITTPPALYVLGIPFCYFERYTNSVLIAITFAGFCRFRRLFHRDAIHSSATAVILFPVLLHSSVLFYTDLLSVCAVIWGFTLDSPLLSSLAFAVGVLTRQTNIVWAGFCACVRLVRDVNMSRPISGVISSFVRLSSFIFLAFSFVLFVYINGGIVLGDASAHQPRLHLAQFLYLSLFSAVHAWPHAIPRLRSLLSKLYWLFPVALSAHYFAFDHPYLLADNRHVTFYLWRWWLRVPARRVLLTPLFVGSFIYIRDLSNHVSPLVRILFVLCSFAVVVPAHLIEPRYFIIPYVLWRLSAKITLNRVLVTIEILSQLYVFSSIYSLFLFVPFEWANEPGVKQRFMW